MRHRLGSCLLVSQSSASCWSVKRAGTSEFYRARAAITQHPVAQHGLTVVAAEADWPDAAAIDRYVRQLPKEVAVDSAIPEVSNLDVAKRRGPRAGGIDARLQPRPGCRTAGGVFWSNIYNLRGSIAARFESILAPRCETSAV